MEEVINLIATTNALNFGIGLPNCPSHLIQSLKDVIDSGDYETHQYAPLTGEPNLLNSLSMLYSKLCNRTIEPTKNVVVTIGATSALICSMMSLLEPGDEAIIIQPAYKIYEPQVRAAKGVPIPFLLKLRSGSEDEDVDWYLDQEELESKFNSKTKLIIVNNPNNPAGKVFTEEELLFISGLCKKYNAYCISDEVYEYLVFGDAKHIRIATLDGMWDRTITIGSAGKGFGITGWRLGWAYGPEHLMKNFILYHEITVDSCPSFLQTALSKSMDKEYSLIGTTDSYWHHMCNILLTKQKRIMSIFKAVGLRPLKPQSGFLILVDISDVASKIDLSEETGKMDLRFVKWMCRVIGIGTIHGSCFYGLCEENIPENFIRFSYAVSDEALDDLENKLSSLKKYMKSD